MPQFFVPHDPLLPLVTSLMGLGQQLRFFELVPTG